VTIYSSDHVPPLKNGSFHSPNYPSNYPSNLRCVFYIIGLPNERIQLSFTDFNVKGIPSRYVSPHRRAPHAPQPNSAWPSLRWQA